MIVCPFLGSRIFCPGIGTDGRNLHHLAHVLAKAGVEQRDRSGSVDRFDVLSPATMEDTSAVDDRIHSGEPSAPGLDGRIMIEIDSDRLDARPLALHTGGIPDG